MSCCRPGRAHDLPALRQVLLFLSKQTDPPSAASRAVALSKYMLAHELPEHFAKRAAAFVLVLRRLAPWPRGPALWFA